MSKPRPEFVAVKNEEGVLIHATDVSGNYGTFCGVSVDDDESVGRVVALPPKKPKISCRTCASMIRAAKRYRESDLAKSTAD